MAGCGTDDAGHVEAAFRGYHTALLARDFPAACAATAPDSTAKLVAAVARQGITATTCEDALAAIFAEPGPAATADGVARSVTVQRVTVDGDSATLAWSATLDGENRPSTSTLRRRDGRWQLVTG